MGLIGKVFLARPNQSANWEIYKPPSDFTTSMKILARKYVPNHRHRLKRVLSDCDSVLDLGCGPSSPLQYCNLKYSVGVEFYEQYLAESIRKGIHDFYISADIRKMELSQKSFDAVVLLDVLEHLSKEDGLALIAKMESWARKKIVIFTPNGFLSQEHDLDGNPMQKHISGWTVEELEKLGFSVAGANGWKTLRGEQSHVKYRPKLLFYAISQLTQMVTRYFPEYAHALFAVKELKY